MASSFLVASAELAKDISEPTSVQQRRKVASYFAMQCSQILKKEFGAQEVIVFGSLRGDTPWHKASDLDIAVSGLSKDRLREAADYLWRMLPEWLPLDLVSIERVDDRVRDRILKLTPMPQNIFLETKVRLQDEIYAISQTVKTLNALLAQADAIPNIALIPAAAGYVEDFYSGCERLAERVVVTFDDGLPEGRNWHQKLLLQVSEPGGKGRPPLWNASFLETLDDYRSFRHRVRHLYNIDLDDDRVLVIAGRVPEIFEQTKQAVAEFSHWLDEMSA
ncbi:MAG: nucleotidyltransferase domain-containing protein [Cyanobacteria bacterium J06588_5]